MLTESRCCRQEEGTLGFQLSELSFGSRFLTASPGGGSFPSTTGDFRKLQY